MTNVNLVKRAFTLAVVAMTILWTGAAGLAPLMTSATVSLSDGDLIKGESFSTVYYYDGSERFTYPNENTYFSWHADFNDVVTISDSQLAGITLGGNVVYRPGTRWVKIQSDDNVYAVTPDGTLRWIETQEVAEALYGGSGWNTFIDDVPDTFFADYTIGASLMTADALYDGALVDADGTTYLMWDGELREVSSAGMSANDLMSSSVLDTTVDVTGLTMGSDLTGYSEEISDVTQVAEGDGDVAQGDIMVSVASSTPAGAYLPGGATRVEMTTWKFTGEGTVNSLIVSLDGVNATTDISNVYLYQGDTRLTEARSVNSATRQALFSNLGVDVDGSAYLTLVAEVATSPTGGETVFFTLDDVDSVGSLADVAGSFPLSGNVFTLSNDNAGYVLFEKSGTIIDPAIGADDATIGLFKVTADSEDAILYDLRLKIDNATDHSDFKLWDGSDLIANGVWASGDLVDFEFDSPFTIIDGGSNVFTVSADIGGNTGDDIKVYVDKDVDVNAIGGDYGYGLQVHRASGDTVAGSYDGTSCIASTGDCSFSDAAGGDITITFNGPASGDIGVDSQDVTLMEFTLSTTQDITVKDFDLIISSDDNGSAPAFESETDANADDTAGLVRTVASVDTEANFKDVSIRYADTGFRLLGPVELTVSDASVGDAYQLLTLSDDFSMLAGESLDLIITADIDNNDPGSNNVAVAINQSEWSFEDVNGDSITTNIVPSGDINGNTFTTRAASLVFALASSPTSFTTVQGADDITMLGLTATAGQGEDVTVTALTFDAYGDTDSSGTWANGGEDNAQVEDFISSCSIYDGDDTLLAGPEGPQTSGQYIIFNNMDWTIPAGTVERLNLVCNLANPSDSSTAYFAFDIDDTLANATVEDEDGDSVDATADGPNGDIDTALSQPTVEVTVATSGSLAVALDSSSPDSKLLMTGTSDNWVSSFKFTATNEDIEINTMTFVEGQADSSISLSDDNTGAVDTYANNIASVSIAYDDINGDTQTKTAYMTSNEVNFSGLDMYVSKNDPAVVDVYVDIPESDRKNGYASTNERIELTFYEDDASGTDAFSAVGLGSGTTFDESETGIAHVEANFHPIVETMPTISLHASSPSGASVPGMSEVFRYTVSAASNEDVVIREQIFKVTSTDNGSTMWNECDSANDDPQSFVDQGSDFSLFNYSDLGTDLTDDAEWEMLKSTGLDCDTTSADVAFLQLEFSTDAEAITIAAGTTETFSLWIDTTDASAASDDAFRIDIPEDPIVAIGSWAALDGGDELNAALDHVTTAIVVDATVDDAVEEGMILCIADDDSACAATDEQVLVSGETANTTVHAMRGYAGTNKQITAAIGDDVFYMHSSLVWFDDGDTTNTATAYEDEVQGSYLINNLPIIGGTMVF